MDGTPHSGTLPETTQNRRLTNSASQLTAVTVLIVRHLNSQPDLGMGAGEFAGGFVRKNLSAGEFAST
jgi:hypothetical protein